MRPEPDRADRFNGAAFTRDGWYVLAGARTANAPRTLAAARDAVFRRYLPMARMLATNGPGSEPFDPVASERAAKCGWRRACSAGGEGRVRRITRDTRHPVSDSPVRGAITAPHRGRGPKPASEMGSSPRQGLRSTEGQR